MKKRTSLRDRMLPVYTRGEEIFHMVSHTVGDAVGVVMLLSCVIVAALHHNIRGIATGCVYGLCTVLLYTMSSIYHGLKPGLGKKVFQVLDHCSIYLMIAGTYTPVLLGAYLDAYPTSALVIFIGIWALAILGITLTAIDLKRYQIISMCCYLGMGWAVVFQLPRLLGAYGLPMILLLMSGGIIYTGGVIFYSLGKRKKYMHSIFHVCINVATVLQFLGIVIYVMPG